ncbi:MAG TPA: hypothetical protein VFH45_00770 [Acidimicrobiales bacterium]|nr:hypothetical protein [Acidimicrobiales bacterium]
MKRYRFRLAGVLRVRRLEEEAARGRLFEARAALVAATTAVEAALAHYRSAPQPLGEMSLEELSRHRLLADLAASSLAAARTAAEQAAATAAIRQAEWSAAAARVAVLERLDERRREEHRLEADRAEVAVLDDLTTSRHRTAETARA